MLFEILLWPCVYERVLLYVYDVLVYFNIEKKKMKKKKRRRKNGTKEKMCIHLLNVKNLYCKFFAHLITYIHSICLSALSITSNGIKNTQRCQYHRDHCRVDRHIAPVSIMIRNETFVNIFYTLFCFVVFFFRSFQKVQICSKKACCHLQCTSDFVVFDFHFFFFHQKLLRTFRSNYLRKKKQHCNKVN